MKKIQIVTGAAGFVGFSVSLSLLKKGNNIIGIDNVNNYYNTLIKMEGSVVLPFQALPTITLFTNGW